MSKPNYSQEELLTMRPTEYRRIARENGWPDADETIDVCRGYAQANLVMIPKEHAFDFLLFCHLNPRPFPVIDVTEPGDPHPRRVAPQADLRTDLVKYRVFRNGDLVDEPHDVLRYWRSDLVCFVIGCGNSFEWVFRAAGLRYRTFGDYMSNLQLVPAGPFHGRMAVSPMAFKEQRDAVRAIQITSRLLAFHGPPVHCGSPGAIGVEDLMQPDARRPRVWPVDPPQLDELVMSWGCGAGLPEVARVSKVDLMITHFSGRMLVTDLLAEELAVL